MNYDYLWSGLAAAAAFIVYSLWTAKDVKRAPGPAGLPFIGNALSIPSKSPGPYFYFEQLAKKYGDVIRLTAMGDELLLLNNHKDVEELLVQRSNNFSSRRPLIYSSKYQAKDRRLVMLQYGPDWRKQRAAFFDMLNPRSVAKYDTVMQEQSARLLADVVRSPPAPTKTASRTLNEQIASYTGNLVMTLTYGSKLATPENLSAVMPIMKGVLFDAAPGAHLVDTFPILDRLPDWLSSWRAEANAKHAYESKLYLRLVRSVREDMLAGNAEECFATRLWDDHDEGKFDELTLAYVAGSAFEASIRTTAGTLMWMIMALVMNPHVQKKAHQEIDNVLLATHDTTLEPPTLDLLTKLPYCVAIIKEAMRWMPVAPGAFPHAATNDDTYKGYFIPKGTLVFPNIFAMHRDPRNYVEPDSFDPERFMSVTTDMGSNEIFVEGHWAFGFGRRICPARYLAGKLLFTAAVRLLWAFDFKPVFDENGKPMAIDRFDCPWEVLNEPNPFPVQVTPRSEKHAEKIIGDWSGIESA